MYQLTINPDNIFAKEKFRCTNFFFITDYSASQNVKLLYHI